MFNKYTDLDAFLSIYHNQNSLVNINDVKI